MTNRVIQRWHLEDAVRRLDYPVGHYCPQTFETTITEATIVHRVKLQAAKQAIFDFDQETAGL